MFKTLFFLSGLALASGQEELLVQTTSGPVQGYYNGMKVREWDGIRYAAPPLGEKRWEQSTPPEPWTDVFMADFMAPACPQICVLPPGTCPLYGTDEDCLYLTVMGPTDNSTDTSGWPVYFWMHGGSYEQGSGNTPLYNGTQFALQGVITVVVNYRLSSLGFLASTSMEGNYGLRDQVLALQWVRDNIAGFGGNADRITIGGQSAGGMSVGAFLTAPSTEGMFSQAVMESNPLALPFHTRETMTLNSDAMFEYCNCPVDDVECMRQVPVDMILEAQKKAPSINLDNLLINFLPFSPMVEGVFLLEQPLTALAGGRMHPVPVVSGTVLDEGQMFVYELFTSPMNKVAYEITLLGIFGKEMGKQLSKLYPYDTVPGAEDGRTAMNYLATDLMFYCPLRNATRGYRAALGADAVPTYEYRFDHVMSFDCWGEDYAFCVGYVCHGSELAFEYNVFGDGEDVTYDPDADEQQLTIDVSDMWSNFIATGNPNTGLSTPHAWPLYGSKDELLALNEPVTELKTHQREKYCDFWDKYGYYY